MYKTLEYETEMHYSKRECLEELAAYLSQYYQDITIIDIEKEWKENKGRADYSPRLYLSAIILYKIETE